MDSQILDDYDELLNQYRLLKEEVSEVKQNYYDSSRQLKINEALLTEYRSEIELLQSREKSENKKFEAKIALLEETIANLRTTHLENVLSMEAELEKKEKENNELKNEIIFFKENKEVLQAANVSVDLNEIFTLTNENESLKQQQQELEEAFNNLHCQHSKLENTFEQYKEEITELRESLKLKKEELSENAILIEKLNDELFCANKELQNYKQKPLEVESKGNSLFAEVDDRRVHLQETVNEMKSGYIRLKQETSQQVKQIAHLRKQNAELRAVWKKDLEEIQDDNNWVLRTLKRHVKVLEETVENQKKQLEEQPKFVGKDSSPEYQFYHQMIMDKSNEIEEWKKKYSDTTINEHLLAVDLAQANKQVKLLRLEIKQLGEELKDAKSATEKSDVFCDRCKTIKEDRIKNRRTEIDINFKAPDSKPLKSCLKVKEEPTPEDNETLDCSTIRDCIKKDGHFNIFNLDVPRRRKVEILQPSNAINEEDMESTLNHDSKEEHVSYGNKENIVSIDDSLDGRQKEGVTFAESTVDPVINPMRRKGARMFVLKKKE